MYEQNSKKRVVGHQPKSILRVYCEGLANRFLDFRFHLCLSLGTVQVWIAHGQNPKSAVGGLKENIRFISGCRLGDTVLARRGSASKGHNNP